jgi:hypothetical protein
VIGWRLSHRNRSAVSNHRSMRWRTAASVCAGVLAVFAATTALPAGLVSTVAANIAPPGFSGLPDPLTISSWA